MGEMCLKCVSGGHPESDRKKHGDRHCYNPKYSDILGVAKSLNEAKVPIENRWGASEGGKIEQFTDSTGHSVKNCNCKAPKKRENQHRPSCASNDNPAHPNNYKDKGS